jgi:hypothetical protein
MKLNLFFKYGLLIFVLLAVACNKNKRGHVPESTNETKVEQETTSTENDQTPPAEELGNQKDINTADIVDTVSGKLQVGDFQRTPPRVGYNQSSEWKPASTDGTFDMGVAKLSAEIIRYPGGSISQFFDWRTGSRVGKDKLSNEQKLAKSNLREKIYRKKKNQEAYTLEVLKQEMNKHGLDVVFCLNLLTSTLEEQLAMLEAAQRIGIPVKYVELGNEVFFGDKLFRLRFAHGRKYATEMNQWKRVIQQKFPNAMIAAAGNLHDYDDVRARRDNWNQAVFEKINKLEALTIHVYPEYGDFALQGKSVADNLVRIFV